VKALIALTCILIVAGAFGGVPTRTGGVAEAGDRHSKAAPQAGTGMGHEVIEVEGDSTPSSVKLTVHKDPKAGWNLQMQVENFRLAPEHASTTYVPREGHAHLYIDSKKVTRLYGEWYHIPVLPPGVHKITVTLNANSHEDLAVKGKVVSATQEVRVSAK